MADTPSPSPERRDTAVRLALKPDWPQACRRWVAFWERAATDRPCLDVRAPRPADLPPLPEPADLETYWTDPDYIGRSWVRSLETTYFAGEAVPTGGFLMAGWTLGCGPGLTFARDTIWHPVVWHRIEDPLPWHPGPEDWGRQRITRILERLLELAPGRFLVTYAMQVPVNDLFPLLRGVEAFLIDLVDHGETCRRRLDEALALWIDSFEALRAVVDARQRGCVWGWPGLWHPEMVLITQSDMSCMLSPALFESFVMREMDALGERYGVLWYHVDGPLAIRHVPTLLSRPYLRAIQYVPGDGQPPNGPAYLGLYRQVQAAGRCLDLDAPLENIEFLIRHLRPEGLVLRTHTSTLEEAEELVSSAARWCGSHVGRG